jgi:hypothetical protein
MANRPRKVVILLLGIAVSFAFLTGTEALAASATKINGTVISLVDKSEVTRVTIRTEGGEDVLIYVDENTVIKRNKAIVEFYDLEVGDQVKITCKNLKYAAKVKAKSD